jgi:Pilus formation protein N terminal region
MQLCPDNTHEILYLELETNLARSAAMRPYIRLRGNRNMRSRPACRRTALFATLFFASLATQPAGAIESIRLNPGYVSLIKLNKAIGTIVIGNPDVVDVTPRGTNSILFTAKKITGNGTTNVIVLDPQDAEIFNATIIVGSQGGMKTEIHSKGKSGSLHEYWAYRCMPTCERVEDKLETFQHVAAPEPAPTNVVVPPQGPSDIPANPAVPQY